MAAQNWIAQLTPLHATSSGKVLLAHLEPEARDALLDEAGLARFTDHTITARKVLVAQLEIVLAEGYATTFEEYEDGLNAMAVPVRDHTGTVVGALSVSGPAYRLDKSRMQDLLERLRDGGARLGDRMGHLA